MCLPFCATRGSKPWLPQPTQAVGGFGRFHSNFSFISTFFTFSLSWKNQGVCAGAKHRELTAVLALLSQVSQ